MATNFPISIDDFPNPNSATYLNSSDPTLKHSVQHTNINDAVEALEAKVGVNASAVTTSLDYMVKNASSIDPGHKHSVANITDIATYYLKLDGSNDPITGNIKINVASATALVVEQTGVKNNVLVVDTSNARIGVNRAPSAEVVELQVTGGASNIANYTYQSAIAGSGLLFYHARGTAASPSILQNGDYCGEIMSYAYDGSTHQKAGQSYWVCDGAVSAGNTPTAYNIATWAGGTGLRTHQTIYNTGIVDFAYQSKSAAYQTVATACTASAYTIVIFDTKEYDTHLEYNATTGIVTILKSGWYNIGGMTKSVAAAWASDQYWVTNIFKNGALSKRGTMQAVSANRTQSLSSLVTADLYLAATETIDIRVWHNRGGGATNTDVTARAYNYFYIHKFA